MTQINDTKKPRKSKDAKTGLQECDDDEEVVIYGLTSPATGELRYIGKARDMGKRLKSHISESRTRKRPVNCWIAKLTREGVTPDIFEIAKVAGNQWCEEEAHWIAYFRSLGANLLNIADGGDQPKTSKDQLQRAARTATSKRDPDIFRLKKFMEGGLRAMRNFGDPEMVKKQEARMRLVNSLTTEQQKRLAILTFKEPTEEERAQRVKRWRESEEAHRAKANEGNATQEGASFAV